MKSSRGPELEGAPRVRSARRRKSGVRSSRGPVEAGRSGVKSTATLTHVMSQIVYHVTSGSASSTKPSGGKCGALPERAALTVAAWVRETLRSVPPRAAGRQRRQDHGGLRIAASHAFPTTEHRIRCSAKSSRATRAVLRTLQHSPPVGRNSCRYVQSCRSFLLEAPLVSRPLRLSPRHLRGIGGRRAAGAVDPDRRRRWPGRSGRAACIARRGRDPQRDHHHRRPRHDSERHHRPARRQDCGGRRQRPDPGGARRSSTAPASSCRPASSTRTRTSPTTPSTRARRPSAR